MQSGKGCVHFYGGDTERVLQSEAAQGFSGMPKFWSVCSIIGWHALQRNVSVAGSHVCLFVPIEKLPHRLLNAAAFLSGLLFVCSFPSECVK